MVPVVHRGDDLRDLRAVERFLMDDPPVYVCFAPPKSEYIFFLL
jgi:hypothetical protein